ncbi:hypothetical protein B0T10DRAFT_560134 [Thelonectria olida]|uniref:Uncharacterized protein n=1 Tax=Thelonectria olida TaxID=1576542 RepID=A0A9P8W7S0_9HYPO|nr:hypothetical protein B0T10DRAFT_560134 [Thelonectria olida]
MHTTTIFASALALAQAAVVAPTATKLEAPIRWRLVWHSRPCHHTLDSSTRSGWIKIYDANGYLIFQNDEIWQDQGSTNYLTAEFRYGANEWRSGKANSELKNGNLLICSVGNWNLPSGLLPSFEEIDLDCGFFC